MKRSGKRRKRKPRDRQGQPARTEIPDRDAEKAGKSDREFDLLKMVPGTLGLLALVFLFYAPALGGGFVWDDHVAITGNSLLTSLDGLGRIWWEPSAIPGETHYWPLAYTTFWLEYHLWGLHPLGFHMVNVLLHAFSGWLLWRILLYLRIPGAWLAAAIFLVHPIHVESVAWVVERKDVLSAAFYFLALWTYFRLERHSSAVKYGLALAFLGCALLSKTITVSFPVTVLCILWWRGGRVQRKQLVALIPFFLLAIAIAVGDVWFNRSARAVSYDLSWSDKWFIASRNLVFYLGKLFWPADLMAYYPKWQLSAGHLARALLPAVVGASLGGLWLLRKKISRGPVTAAFVYVVTLGPILGLVEFVFMKYSFVADRFQYLASAAPIVLFASGLQAGLLWKKTPPKWLAWAVFGGLLGLLGVLTWNQCKIYRDEETFFRYQVAKNPSAWAAHYNLGNAVMEQGKTREAIEHYAHSIRLKPDHGEAHLNLGTAWASLGKTDEAFSHFSEAIRVDPELPDAHYNMANILTARGDVAQAVEHYREALRLKQDWAVCANNLAWLLATDAELRDGTEAVRLAEGACQHMKTHQPIFLNTLAAAYAEAGRFEDAVRVTREALDLARAAGNESYGRKLEERLRSYESERPFRIQRRVQPLPTVTPMKPSEGAD